MATIPFAGVPADTRVPFAYFELDASKANTAAQVQRTLLIGQVNSLGAGPAGAPVRIDSIADAKAIGGPASLLARAAAAYRANDPLGELWLLPVPETGAAASGSVTFTGPTTAAGTLSLYIGGDLLALPLAAGTTAAQAASALVAAFGTHPDLLLGGAIDGANPAKVNVAARNAGLAAGDVDLRVNHLGSGGGESLPAGLGVTLVQLGGGAGVPSLTAGLAALGEVPFDFILCPYTDAASLAALKAFLDTTAGRWAPSSQLFGHAFAGYRGTSGALTTFGVSQNDPHMSIIGLFDAPTPPWLWAAATMGAVAASARQDPAMPLQTLAVQGVVAPPVASRFTKSMRDTLLHSGLSTYTVGGGGAVAIENMITTYQQTPAGQPDTSYLEVETLFTLAAVLRRLREVVQIKFGRVKLAADGTRLSPGRNVVTPAIIRAEIIAAYRQMEQEDGWTQQSDAFAAGLVVQKSTTHPGRVDALLPLVLIEQLRVFAALAQFRLF